MISCVAGFLAIDVDANIPDLLADVEGCDGFGQVDKHVTAFAFPFEVASSIILAAKHEWISLGKSHLHYK